MCLGTLLDLQIEFDQVWDQVCCTVLFTTVCPRALFLFLNERDPLIPSRFVGKRR